MPYRVLNVVHGNGRIEVNRELRDMKVSTDWTIYRVESYVVFENADS